MSPAIASRIAVLLTGFSLVASRKRATDIRPRSRLRRPNTSRAIPMHQEGQRRPRLASAVAVSCAYHLAAVAVLLIAIRSEPQVTTEAEGRLHHVRTDLVYHVTE